MKKISLSNIGKIFKISKEGSPKRGKLPELKPDTFEHQIAQENVTDNLNHLKFDVKKVKFYDEDLKKMESMTLEERVEYKAKLKAEKRYTYEE